MLLAKIVLCASALALGAPQASEQKPQPTASAKAEAKAGQPTPPLVGQRPPQTADRTAKPQPQSPAASETDDEVVDGVKLRAIEANLVSYTNQERVRYGLPPFEVDKELMETAREQASWMTRNRSLVHTARPVAENIAMGQPHSSSAVQAWMNSSGHRANILNAGHRRIGVAAFRTVSGTIFWCQQFRP